MLILFDAASLTNQEAQIAAPVGETVITSGAEKRNRKPFILRQSNSILKHDPEFIAAAREAPITSQAKIGCCLKEVLFDSASIQKH